MRAHLAEADAKVATLEAGAGAPAARGEGGGVSVTAPMMVADSLVSSAHQFPRFLGLLRLLGLLRANGRIFHGNKPHSF